MGKEKDSSKKPSSGGCIPPKKQSYRSKSEMAALYHEDIVGGALASTTSSSILLTAPSSSRPSSIGSINLNREEQQRRKTRMARFTAAATCAKNAQTSTTSQPPRSLTDSLGQALTSSRGEKKITVRNNEASSFLHHSEAVAAFVGTSTDLEKKYLRLTTFPRPCDVRPEAVLRKALHHIKNRYLQTEDFDWTNEQLKSVRQDLTVQSIRNALTLDVYETHARILLEHGDLNEFNQCQSNIQSLIQNSNYNVQQSQESLGEFRAYAILYALVRNAEMDLNLLLQKYRRCSKNTAASVSCIKKKPKRRRHNYDDPINQSGSSPTTKFDSHYSAAEEHAWQVVRAVKDNGYRKFFRLYYAAPHLSAYLMDFLVQRVRGAAYQRLVAAYRPHVSCEFVKECLQLDDLEETRRFLKQQGAVYLQENNNGSGCSSSGGRHEPPFWIDCKLSFQKQQNQLRTDAPEKSSLKLFLQNSGQS